MSLIPYFFALNSCSSVDSAKNQRGDDDNALRYLQNYSQATKRARQKKIEDLNYPKSKFKKFVY